VYSLRHLFGYVQVCQDTDNIKTINFGFFVPVLAANTVRPPGALFLTFGTQVRVPGYEEHMLLPIICDLCYILGTNILWSFIIGAARKQNQVQGYAHRQLELKATEERRPAHPL
jgi:hypothetical protein